MQFKYVISIVNVSYLKFEYIVTASCTNGNVEIDPSTGLVSICTNGAWYLLCPQYWSESEAQVTCREQGLNPNGNSMYQ